MESIETQLPDLLSDHPERTDAFGAHSAIARSLAELIVEEREGRCVALQGSWGSGKSTVVRMLSDYLAEKADIFVFDTWSTQGDPLRFTFMGAFANWCLKFPSLRSKVEKWKGDIDDISRRATRESSEERRLRPAQAQWLAALLIVALPVGLALASDQWSKLIGEPLAFWIYIAGFLLVISPFIYLLGLWWFFGMDFFKEIVKAIENSAEDTKRIIVRRGPLATSIEFIQKIRTYCEALHDRDKERKLLIIFDNIDRVAEHNSAKVWSLLTELLEVIHEKDAAYKANIWVLVPVDLDSIPIPISRKSASGPSPIASRGDTGASDEVLKLEFIEKTFQLNIVVPQPLSVASERYFECQYKLAFGKTRAANDWYECYSVFRARRTTSRAFTPRAIKRFINDLVGLWRSRHQIESQNMPSIQIMALYLCLRERVSDPDDIVSEIGKELSELHLPDNNPLAVFAAVAFGSKIAEGLQILVSARIDSALGEGHSRAFEDLINIDGFALCFANYVRDNQGWVFNDLSKMAKVYELIGEFDVGVQNNIAHRVSAVTRFLVRPEKITGEIDARVAAGIAQAHIFENSDGHNVQLGLQAILDSLATQLDSQSDIGTRWFFCAERFIQTLLDRGVSFDCVTINLPDSEGLALQVLQRDIRRLRFEGMLKFVVGAEVVVKLEQQLLQSIGSSSLSRESVIVSQTLREIAPKFSMVGASGILLQRFQNAGHFQADPLAATFAIVDDTVRIEQNGAFYNQVAAWIRNGVLYHHYSAAVGDKAHLTDCFLGLCAGFSVASNQVAGWNQSGQGVQNFIKACDALSGDALTRTHRYLKSVNRFRDVIKNAQTLGIASIRERLLREMLTQRECLYTSETYCQELSMVFGQLSEGLRNELTEFAVEELRLDEYLSNLSTVEPNLKFSEYLSVGAAIVDLGRKSTFYRRVGELLQTEDHDWWKRSIGGRDEAVLELMGRISDVIGPGWLKSSDARRAVTDFIVGQAFITDGPHDAYIDTLMSALSPDERSMVLQQVKNKALVQLGDLSEFIRFRKLAGFIFTDTEVIKDIDAVIINVLIPAIERDEANREIVMRMVEEYDLIHKLSNKARTRLSAALTPSEPRVEPTSGSIEGA